MLKIQNPIGKALMVTNPFHGGSMSRYRRRRSRRRHSRRRNPAGGALLQVSTQPVTKAIPSTRELTRAAGTVIAGGTMFMGSHAIGVAIQKLLDRFNIAPTARGATATIKFLGRWAGARLVATTAFKQRRGFLSHENGRFLVNISIIAGGIALLRDLGIVDMLPEQVRDYVPQLAAYDAGVRSGSLSRFRRLRAYDAGIHRGNLSAYDAGVARRSLSQAPRAHYDNMPVETVMQPTYGVPWGA